MRQNSIIFHTSLSDTPTTVGISLFRFSHTCLIENNCALRVGDEMKEILAERLKQCRKERGFSQRETASLWGLNYVLLTARKSVDKALHGFFVCFSGHGTLRNNKCITTCIHK